MTTEKETVAPYIFAGLPKVLQNDFIQRPYADLMRNIYNDIDKVGGLIRYRDAVILEVCNYGSAWYEQAYRRQYDQSYHNSVFWTPTEDAYILKNIGVDKKMQSHITGRSIASINNRLFNLRGSVVKYKKRGK